MRFSIAESVLVFQRIVLPRGKNNRQHFPGKLRETKLLLVKGTEEHLPKKKSVSPNNKYTFAEQLSRASF